MTHSTKYKMNIQGGIIFPIYCFMERSQLDLDDGFFFQRAEILSKSLFHFTFIIIPQNPLLDLLKGKRLYSFSIKEFNNMEAKFRSYDPAHLSNLKAESFSLKGRDEFPLLKK